MKRNLLQGRTRSFITNGVPKWLLRTNGPAAFDPSCVITSGTATWIFGDGASQTANSATHSYSVAGNYPVSWDVLPDLVKQLDVRVDGVTKINTKPWTNLTTLYCYSNSLTTLDTFAAWTNLTYLYCYSNSLTTLDTFAEWTSLTTLSCGSNSLTTLDTFAAWTNLTYLSCYSNSLTTLDTFAAWTNLTTLYCYSNSLTTLNTFAAWTNLTYLYCGSNSLTTLDTFAEWTNLTYLYCGSNSLTTLDTFAEWTSLTTLYCYSNNLTATVIDDILVNLDTAGASNGLLDYSSNPGASDSLRSGAATTAKANLIVKGWVITI